jgi:hypothetical protein
MSMKAEPHTSTSTSFHANKENIFTGTTWERTVVRQETTRSV